MEPSIKVSSYCPSYVSMRALASAPALQRNFLTRQFPTRPRLTYLRNIYAIILQQENVYNIYCDRASKYTKRCSHVAAVAASDPESSSIFDASVKVRFLSHAPHSLYVFSICRNKAQYLRRINFTPPIPSSSSLVA